MAVKLYNDVEQRSGRFIISTTYMTKIKHYLIFSVAATVLFCGAVFANAEAATTRVMLPPAPKSSSAASAKAEIARLQALNKTKLSDLRAVLQSRIAAIANAGQQDAALTVIGQFARANQVATDHFTDVLDRLNNVLLKIESRTAKAKAQGSDVTAAEQAIQKAKDAITAARSAVMIQAQKSYQNSINVQAISTTGASTPDGQNSLISSLRTQFQAARNTLQNDLFAVRDGAVKSARAAVQNALNALKSVPNVDKAN